MRLAGRVVPMRASLGAFCVEPEKLADCPARPWPAICQSTPSPQPAAGLRRSAMSKRIETDSMGEIEVDDERLWGAQTQRAIEHFRISTERIPGELIAALGIVKRACAQVNRELGLLDPNLAAAIEAAAQEVSSASLAAELPLPVWHTGSGTQT